MSERISAIAAHIAEGQRLGRSVARLTFRESPIPWELRQFRDGTTTTPALVEAAKTEEPAP